MNTGKFQVDVGSDINEENLNSKLDDSFSDKQLKSSLSKDRFNNQGLNLQQPESYQRLEEINEPYPNTVMPMQYEV